MSLIQKVEKTIEKFEMVTPGDRLLVAVSGGPDSVALLHLLSGLSRYLEAGIHAFHLDHRLRPASADDSAFVADLCKRLGVPLESASFDVPAYLKETGLSVEDGARKVRYRLLLEAAERLHLNRIALGHQADDQVETFLMRLIRGSGLTGLSAIPPVRDRFIRPLIEVSKEDILSYLSAIGEGFVIDASNEDLSFFRNRVRRHLIPQMLSDNPAFKEVVGQTIEIIREDEAQLEGEARRKFEELVNFEARDILSFPAQGLSLLPPALARRVVRTAIEGIKGDLTGIEFKHVKLVLEGLAAGVLRMDLPGELAAVLEGGELLIGTRSALGPAAPGPVELKLPGATDLVDFEAVIEADMIDIQDLKLAKKPDIAQVDADIVGDRLSARGWRPGDSFMPLGLGSAKKLQDFFVDEKVPRRKKNRIPIVEAAGRIVWVAGMRIDDRFRVTPSTKKVLILRLKRKA